MIVELIYTGDRFEFECEYGDRMIPKRAGFRWDPRGKIWYTGNAEVADRLSDYASSFTKTTIAHLAAEYKEEHDQIVLIHRGGRFDMICHYDNRHIPKDAGFRWDPEVKRWYTDDPEIAAELAEYADDHAKSAMGLGIAAKDEAIEASHKADADIEVPSPEGLEYLPFQKAGIAYAQDRDDVLIADDMGLGKTIQALGIVNADETIQNVLVVCPASLKINWQREAEKWLVRDMPVTVINGTKKKTMPDGGVVVMNYDILSKHRPWIDTILWDLIVYDESHMLKNGKSLRSKKALGFWHRDPEKRIAPIKARRRVFLTGTPILNRPSELWTTVHSLAPEQFPSWKQFVQRYCAAYEGRWGWDVSGASNLDELQDKLRSLFMVRRLKADVLTELPPKMRQVIVFPAKQSIIRREKKYAATLKDVLGEVSVPPIAFEKMSKARHESALDKVDAAVEHIVAVLEEQNKVVVFCHHRDVLARLVAALAAYNPVKLQGGDSAADKQAAVDRFQTDPGCGVFVGSIQAAGVGITLTAASLAVFVELDWTPGIMTQAEDRLHRIGTEGSVLIQHLVFDQSIDARMAEALVEKQAVIEQVLD